MHRQTERSAQDESGFTLIELLVVILIIGVLAAIAIPSFVNQKGKATGASAKELARSAQMAAETIGVDNDGSYASVTPTSLNGVENSINISSGSGSDAYISAASGTTSSFTVTATATNADTFTITRAGDGSITRTCTAAAVGTSGCPAGNTW